VTSFGCRAMVEHGVDAQMPNSAPAGPPLNEIEHSTNGCYVDCRFNLCAA
jgi:hypothetical protein